MSDAKQVIAQAVSAFGTAYPPKELDEKVTVAGEAALREGEDG